MKKSVKKLILIFLIIMINAVFCNINIVQAGGLSDVITGGDGFISAGENANSLTFDKDILENKLQETSSYVYNILLFIGMAVALIIAGILGIKFMIGSTEEKAQIKDALVPFVIGCVVIFGAFGIWKIFVTIGNGL